MRVDTDNTVYFVVPVDCATLRACRKKCGYSSIPAFEAELKSKGYSISYSHIEQRQYNPNGEIRRIRGDAARAIASTLGLPVNSVFPQYDAAKEKAVEKYGETYCKLFHDIDERNKAIIDNIKIAEYAALKYSGRLHVGSTVNDTEEAISLAYYVLVKAADDAMRRGVHRGVTFEKYVCSAIRHTFETTSIAAARKSNGYAVLSYEAFIRPEVPSRFNLEDEVISRDTYGKLLKDAEEQVKMQEEQQRELEEQKRMLKKQQQELKEQKRLLKKQQQELKERQQAIQKQQTQMQMHVRQRKSDFIYSHHTAVPEEVQHVKNTPCA